MEKWEIRPPRPQKTLNRLSPKFAWVIRSWIPYPYAKFHYDTITPFAPKYAKIAHQVTRLVFLVLLSAYSQDPCTNSYAECVKLRLFAQGCAFLGSRDEASRRRVSRFALFLAKFALRFRRKF